MGLRDLRKRMQGFNMAKEVEAIINSNSEKIAQLNIDQQRRGQDAFGKPLGKYKSRKYAEAKHARNPRAPFGVYDFWLTGDFQSEFKAGAKNGAFTILSTNYKYERLTEKSPNAFGLNNESIQIARREIIRPALSQAFILKVLKR